jgi:hypothetical protein
MIAREARKKPNKELMYAPMTVMAAANGKIIKPISSYPP